MGPARTVRPSPTRQRQMRSLAVTIARPRASTSELVLHVLELRGASAFWDQGG
jgi:hypothetical protein